MDGLRCPTLLTCGGGGGGGGQKGEFSIGQPSQKAKRYFLGKRKKKFI
jgi:hypothetical protein